VKNHIMLHTACLRVDIPMLLLPQGTNPPIFVELELKITQLEYGNVEAKTRGQSPTLEGPVPLSAP
jgi:hypothetical protein